MGISKSAEKILVIAPDINPHFIWRIDCFHERIGNRTIYLYNILV